MLKYSDASNHKKEHKSILAEFQKIEKMVGKGDVDNFEESINQIKDILINHYHYMLT